MDHQPFPVAFVSTALTMAGRTESEVKSEALTAPPDLRLALNRRAGKHAKNAKCAKCVLGDESSGFSISLPLSPCGAPI